MTTHLDHLIDTTMERLAPEGRPLTSPAALRAILESALSEAYALGRHEALTGLRTIPEAATELGLDRSVVHRLAARRGLGWRVGPMLLLSREEIDNLRHRKPGRPARRHQETTSANLD